MLSDESLRKWASQRVKPYDPAMIQPASIDLKLSNQIATVRPEWLHNPVETFRVTPELSLFGEPRTYDVYVINYLELVLLSSAEYIDIPHDVSTVLYQKSTTARNGLNHLLATFSECGFHGNLTFEVINLSQKPYIIRPNDLMMQLVLHQMDAPAKQPYDGRYQGQTGVTGARLPK